MDRESTWASFDAGWDDSREKALANQITMGICPPGTKLSPQDPMVPPWAKLNAKEKELYTHEMEVYAAYLEFVDHYIGELVGFPHGNRPARQQP